VTVVITIHHLLDSRSIMWEVSNVWKRFEALTQHVPCTVHLRSSLLCSLVMSSNMHTISSSWLWVRTASQIKFLTLLVTKLQIHYWDRVRVRVIGGEEWKYSQCSQSVQYTVLRILFGNRMFQGKALLVRNNLTHEAVRHLDSRFFQVKWNACLALAIQKRLAKLAVC